MRNIVSFLEQLKVINEVYTSNKKPFFAYICQFISKIKGLEENLALMRDRADIFAVRNIKEN